MDFLNNNNETNSILYKKLESELIKSIKNKNFLPGQKYLSDRNIAQLYNVSRSTANRAISDMVKKNLLYRVQGKGTFILQGKNKNSEFSFSGSNSLTDALKESGKEVSTKVLHLYEDCNSEFFQKKLNLEKKSKIVGVQRKRYANLVPFAVETTYVSRDLFPDFLKTDFNNISLYDYMESKNHKPVFFQQYITAIKPNNKVKKILELDTDKFIFKINFTTADNTGTIVEYTESFMDLADMEMAYEVKL